MQPLLHFLGEVCAMSPTLPHMTRIFGLNLHLSLQMAVLEQVMFKYL